MMLLNSTFQHLPIYQSTPGPYNTVETLLDDVSKQMAGSDLRRHSRGANGQRPMTGNMRVSKSNSTSSSPRGSMALNRRKTIIGSNPYRTRPMVIDQSATTSLTSYSFDTLQLPGRSSRPVSWHPSTHVMPQAQFQNNTPMPVHNMVYMAYDMPMTPAVYSGYASPASTFSPLSLPFTAYDHQEPLPEDVAYFPPLDSNHIYATYQSSAIDQHAAATNAFNDAVAESSTFSHYDWNNFLANGFTDSTAPPTPENYLPVQHSSAFEPDDAIQYQPLEHEDAGEELIGMGLYDTPEKPEESDPQLHNYRSLMMQQLMGHAFRRMEPSTQSAGKGLKLEETWAPPPAAENDDNEDDEEDENDEEDAAGSPVVEEVNDSIQMGAVAHSSCLMPGTQHALVNPYGPPAWL